VETPSGRGEPTPSLAPGTDLTIVKLTPDGREAARYPGHALSGPEDWVIARAYWVFERKDLGYLVFDPRDVFVEYFSLTRPYNAFALFTEDDRFKGWYCNVTYPSWIEDGTVYWQDLYIDVVVYPDGRLLTLDEDELDRAGLASRDPALYQMILSARDELIERARTRAFPFSEAPA